MNIFAGLETFLYIVSSSLFYPVIVVLVMLIFWVAISVGSLLREYIERKQGRLFMPDKYKKELESIKHIHNGHLDVTLEKRLQKAEQELVKSLDRIRFVVRVGPAVGLMGTLIPMGIALSALAQGNMPQMAGSMVTAFTTTVTGLACGVISYLISLVKERWARADMLEMEYITELTLRNSSLEIQWGNKDEISEEKTV